LQIPTYRDQWLTALKKRQKAYFYSLVDRQLWVELTSSWVRGESLNPRTKQTNFTKGCTAGPGQKQPLTSQKLGGQLEKE
jgi:hypothetical protein